MPEAKYFKHYRDKTGRLLWVEAFDYHPALVQVGHTIPGQPIDMAETKYQIKGVAQAENTQHINIELIEEVVVKGREPFL